MTLYVVKFGGSSLATPALILQAAEKIQELQKQGNQIVVVVSAMGSQTNDFLALTKNFSEDADNASTDCVLAAGEQVTCGLMALALQSLNLGAQTFLGWQVPILTSQAAGQARIESIDPANLKECLAQNKIPVIAGFQGISAEGKITTLGRGGSDLTAVALAGVLQADQCIFFKDVDGLLSADPRIVKDAHLLPEVTYDEMLELSSLGAKVLNARAVEMAHTHEVPLHIRPTFGHGQGTQIIGDRTIAEGESITGIVSNEQESKFCLTKCPVSAAVTAEIFQLLSEHHITVDMIIQNGLLEGQDTDDLTFTIPRDQTLKAQQLLKKAQHTLGFEDLLISQRIAKISLVGIGIRGHAGVAQRVFKTLADHGLNVHGISTSEIKLSILISADYAAKAVDLLHHEFLPQKDLPNESTTTSPISLAAGL